MHYKTIDSPPTPAKKDPTQYGTFEAPRIHNDRQAFQNQYRKNVKLTDISATDIMSKVTNVVVKKTTNKLLQLFGIYEFKSSPHKQAKQQTHEELFKNVPYTKLK